MARTETVVIEGHLAPGAPDLVYLPVRVPDGVSRIAVRYSYDRPDVPAGWPGNACDVGVFDARGVEAGFRGWSGGARDRFEVGGADATPGYLAGAVMPGEWHIALGPYTVAPQGMDYRVEVTLAYGAAEPAPRPEYPAARVAGRGPGWYRGDCHLHTVYSDGGYAPSDVVGAAREAGLDFIASTEHNTTAGHAAWAGHDDLLILLGEEVTTRNGHWLALGLPPGELVDWRYRARDGVLARYQEQVHRAGGLCVVAHPYGPCVACNWTFGYGGFDAVEVWNGIWTPDDEAAVVTWDAALASTVHTGRWRPAMGNSDAHRPGDTIGLPQTVVLADALDRDAVLAGIRAGRSWIADSSTVDIEVTAAAVRGRRAGIGEHLAAAPDEPVTVRVAVTGVPDGTVRFVTDQGPVCSTPVPDGGVVEWPTTPAASAYVRVEVRRPPNNWPSLDPRFGPMAALTNPIVLGGATGASGATR
jgi:hypothetical protein